MSTSLSIPDPLELYGQNLTSLAQQFPPLIGQDAAISRVFQVLQRRNKANPILLSSDENRRWVIVAEVIRRMAVGDAPEPFSGQQVIALNYETLFTKIIDDSLMRQKQIKEIEMRFVKQFNQAKQESDEEWLARVGKISFWPALEEYAAPNMALERLKEMFIAMQRSPNSILLFVDHFHRLFGGEHRRYPINAFSLLKPALARQQVRLIGACTLEQYRLYIEPDSAIHRRCQEVCLPEA